MRVLALGLALITAAGPVAAQQVTSAPAAVLRVLSKTDGKLEDIEIAAGQTLRWGRLEISMNDCRYPRRNPSGNAFAFLTIKDAGAQQPNFAGWMVASAPALNALDHPRYDVWVLRCKTS
ncbi:DUF2155 domain-containing protein [Algirhabdus cladophorae]|uniref:DUF2155 domain-containing protein n=1 Tax=Algirhabdus cladophorae TaxID=3377108 RepID=UPI003B849BAE